MVSGDQPIRCARSFKDGHDRQDHCARQQGNSMVRQLSRQVEKHENKSQTLRPGLHRFHRGMEAEPGNVKPSHCTRSAISTQTQRSIMGQTQEPSHTTGGQVQRPVENRPINGQVRKARHGHAEVRGAGAQRPTTSPSSSSANSSTGPKMLFPEGKPVTSKVCLGLFSGSARLSKKLSKAGFVVEAWDILFSPKCNLCAVSTLNGIIDRIKRGKVAYVHLGLPCSTWSRARRWDGRGPGPLRDDSEFLMGMPFSTAHQFKLKIGNRLFLHSMRILRCCLKFSVPWTLENPMTSRVWLAPQIKALSAHAKFWRANMENLGGRLHIFWPQLIWFCTFGSALASMVSALAPGWLTLLGRVRTNKAGF